MAQNPHHNTRESPVRKERTDSWEEEVGLFFLYIKDRACLCLIAVFFS